MYEVTKKVTKALERSKAPLSIAEICKKARLREWQVSQELSHLGAMGRLDMIAENLGGTWAAVRGHDPMVVKYSLKPEPDLSFLNS